MNFWSARACLSLLNKCVFKEFKSLPWLMNRIMKCYYLLPAVRHEWSFIRFKCYEVHDKKIKLFSEIGFQSVFFICCHWCTLSSVQKKISCIFNFFLFSKWKVQKYEMTRKEIRRIQWGRNSITLLNLFHKFVPFCGGGTFLWCNRASQKKNTRLYCIRHNHRLPDLGIRAFSDTKSC